MSTFSIALRLAALIAGALACPALAANARHPTVVELFESQGCSSCPPALANVNALGNRADVLPLVFSVTYWDQLGWKDVFAKPAFTARQWDYAHAGGRAQVATPQTIVDGRAAINGGNRAELDRTIAAARRDGGPTIAARPGSVSIGAGRASAPATVWLVRYDPRTIQVPIKAGENGGKTLAHRDIVRAIAPVGSWTGKPLILAIPASPDRTWQTALLLQQGKGGPILAAVRL